MGDPFGESLSVWERLSSPRQRAPPSQTYSVRSPRRSEPTWEGSHVDPSAENTIAHPVRRRYFSTAPVETINTMPRDAKLRSLVQRRRDFFLTVRDPYFHNPAAEQGWDSRAPVSGAMLQHRIHVLKRYNRGDALDRDDPSVLMGIGSNEDEHRALLLQRLPALSPRGRFDYLRKNSRTPASPCMQPPGTAPQYYGPTSPQHGFGSPSYPHGPSGPAISRPATSSSLSPRRAPSSFSPHKPDRPRSPQRDWDSRFVYSEEQPANISSRLRASRKDKRTHA